MKQKRLMITFFLFCMMMLLLMQTESIRANTRQKVKLNYETETKTKSVELYQYKGNGKKNQISNYEFVGEMNDEGNGQWKMMIERAEQNQYALSINHKEYLEYFKKLIKDINAESVNGIESQIASTLVSKMKAASVGGNLRVAIQQPTAYIRAAAVMNPKYMAQAVFKKSAMKKAKEVA